MSFIFALDSPACAPDCSAAPQPFLSPCVPQPPPPQLHSTITHLQVPMLSFNYTFNHLCLLDDGKSCIVDDIVHALAEIQGARAANRSAPPLRYPITSLRDGREAYIGHQLGGVQPLGGGRDGVRVARALQLTYYLQASSPLNEVVAARWEMAFVSELERFSRRHPELGLYPFTSSSLQRDFQRTSRVSERPLLVSLAVCLALAVLCCSMRDCVRTKPWLGLLALVTVSLATLTSAGIFNLSGGKYNSTYLGIPFVMLGKSSHASFRPS